MIKQTISGTIKSVKRLNNSENGNPNYSMTIESNNGVAIPVTTINDYGVNYKIHGGLEGTQLALTVKVNKYSNKLIEVA